VTDRGGVERILPRIILVLSVASLVATGCASAYRQLTQTPAAIVTCFRRHGAGVDLTGSVFPKSVPHESVFVVTFKDLRSVSLPGIPGVPRASSRVRMHPTDIVVVNRSRATNAQSESAFRQWLHDSGATPTTVPTAAQAHLVDYGAAWAQWNPAPLERSRDHRTVLACLGPAQP
jgi:hypothetical protein